MLEQELKDIWNKSSRTAQISIETNQLIAEFTAKMSGIQRGIRMRDIREISASVIGILIYSYLLYEIPFPITKLACVLSIIWFVFVIFKFRKSKLQNTKTDLTSSVTEQLAHQETIIKQQESLLGSAVYWYSAPSFIINFIFIIGLQNPIDYQWTNSIALNILPLTIGFKILTLTGLAFFYSFIIWINKRALINDINPIIENLKIIRNQVEKDQKN